MRKILSILIVSCILCGCSNDNKILLDNYDELNADYKNLEKEFDRINEKLNLVTKDYNELQSELEISKSNLDKFSGIVDVQSEISSLNRDKSILIKDIDDLTKVKENLYSEINNLKNEKKEILSTFTLGQGKYVVGEDIIAGKYIVTAISGSGNFQGNVKDLGGNYGLNEIMAEVGSKYYGDDNAVYNNLRLTDGDYFTINSGLRLQFDKID